MSHIHVKGLMTIPPIEGDEKFLFQMQKIYLDISSKKMDNIDMEIFVDGMSGDFARRHSLWLDNGPDWHRAVRCKKICVNWHPDRFFTGGVDAVGRIVHRTLSAMWPGMDFAMPDEMKTRNSVSIYLTSAENGANHERNG